ncbi:amidohydrolase family protein [Pusillimonas sp.]|uniref:amidohydrolase family protein n=1 Tax=Pusillimonas sp. TaxID=3040095 RepID=UPI0037C96DAF
MGRIRKIAIEEHFTAVAFDDYRKGFSSLVPLESLQALHRQLSDFDDLRIKEMDAAGVDYVILSENAPGIQWIQDTDTAIARARESNDYLASRVARNPDRFGAFAALPMQDPHAAVQELERTVKTMGFKGALVNGHTNGVYYDDPAYDVVWESLQALDVPFYLHPFNIYGQIHAYDGHPVIAGAAWGWGVETATHALRLLFGGVFDRFPGVKLILGHMGEGLPFQRWRFDSRFAAYPNGITLNRAPSEYIGSNIVITTSGVCSPAALMGAIGEMGAEAVMFSVDYPYESSSVAADFIEKAPMDEHTRALVCYGNAERLFKL